MTVIREFFDKNKVPHTWIDADEADGQAALESLGVGPDQLPFVACNRGTRSPRPTVTRLAECLGLKRQIRTEPFDLVIVGAGPAGLAAAVYGASEGLATIVLDRFGPGGQAGTSSRIENYMGFPAGLTGADLANRGYLQALKFGAELVAPVEVRSMTCEDQHAPARPRRRAGRARPDGPDRHRRHLPAPPRRRVRALGRGGDLLFLHLGARAIVPERPRRRGGRRQLGGPGGDVPRRAHRRGRAAACAGATCARACPTTSPAGSSATRRSRSSATSRWTPSRATARSRGFGSATSGTGATRDLDCSAVFVFIGAQPRTDWLPPSIAVDSKGFILTGADAAKSDRWPLTDREPCAVETTCPGVFAAGDVRSGTTKRVAFAVGDGALAVTCAHRVLAEI